MNKDKNTEFNKNLQKRKIEKITVAKDKYGNESLCALSDDGLLFVLNKNEWIAMPELPQKTETEK